MQAATLQAERTATAAKESIKVTKINERPLLELYKPENFECAHLLLSGLTILKDNQYTHRNVDLTLYIRNSGKSLAFLKKVEIRINDREGGLMKIDIETSIPRSSGNENSVKIKTILPIDETYVKNGVFKHSSYKSGKILIFYEDSFSIKYSSEYSVKIDNTYDRSINIIVDENSIIDSFDLH
ncbi:hypothetical protein [Elstera litoralis]|uniref:hypothetical protein n=1 Tax=Elstera litoralis TaxID=552518 RepID=UPI0012EE4ECE|nr:hypothetical protein [Elstera litoralis]